MKLNAKKSIFIVGFSIAVHALTPRSALADQQTYVTGDAIFHLGMIRQIFEYTRPDPATGKKVAVVTRIGNVKLGSLLERTKSLAVYPTEPSLIKNPDNARRAGHYSFPDGTVNIDQGLVEHFDSERQRFEFSQKALFVHEYVSGSGYVDSNYELSSPITLTHFLVSMTPVRPHYAEKLDLWVKYITHPELKFLSLAGGSTTTGGGGDFGPPFYKTEFLYNLIFELDVGSDFSVEKFAALRFILDLRIEVDWERTRTEVLKVSLVPENGGWTMYIPPEFSHPSVIPLLKQLNNSDPLSVLKKRIMPAFERSRKRAQSKACEAVFRKSL